MGFVTAFVPRGNRFYWYAVTDAAFGQRLAKGAAVVAAISGQTHRSTSRSSATLWHADGGQGLRSGFYVSHLSRFEAKPQRKTIAVYDDVPFGGFARSTDADFVAPFLAFT